MTEKKTIDVELAPRGVKWLQGAIAVCIILLMGSIILNFYFWSRGAEYRIEIQKMKAEYDSLQRTVHDPLSK